MMQCRECGADLVPHQFPFEQNSEDGRSLRMDVSGHKGPSCGERYLNWRDAVKVSDEWINLQWASLLRDSTVQPPIATSNTQLREPVFVDSTSANVASLP